MLFNTVFTTPIPFLYIRVQICKMGLTNISNNTKQKIQMSSMILLSNVNKLINKQKGCNV